MVEQEITLELLKKAFYRNIIQLPTGAVRFVAKVERWDSDSDCGAAGNSHKTIFAPASWDDDYNLVLSLATDGRTYPVFDLDTQAAIDLAAIDFATSTNHHLVCVPSSSNGHAYSEIPTDFGKYMNLLTGDGPLANEGYWTMNHLKGYAGLRPPWISKIWGDEFPPTRALQPMYYHRFDWDGIDLEPPEPEGISLADLFGDD